MICNLNNLIRKIYSRNFISILNNHLNLFRIVIVLAYCKGNYFKCLRNVLRSLTLLAQESCELGKQNLNTLIFHLYCRLITQYIYNYFCHQNVYTTICNFFVIIQSRYSCNINKAKIYPQIFDIVSSFELDMS